MNKKCYSFLRKLFYFIQAVIEKIKGVDFVSEVESRREGHVKYLASSVLIYPVLTSYFRSQGIGEQDAIIDVGCGKGRMLIFFSRFPFGKIGGVEYEADLVRICKKNLSTLKIYRINVKQGDAAIYDEYDEYNYFYLFNPFEEGIVQKFLDNILISKKRKNRDIWVLYFNPMHVKVFLNHGFIIERQLPHEIVVLKHSLKP